MIHPSEIRLIATDVDGVWTDGRIIYSTGGEEIKEFHVRDGLGVKLAREAGIEVAIITGRRFAPLAKRADELGIEHVYQGVEDKLSILREIAAKLSIDLTQVVYVGDDLPDLAAMKAVGISAAPSDAVPEVRSVARWRLDAAGGRGAVRELVERLLFERNEWNATVERFLQ